MKTCCFIILNVIIASLCFISCAAGSNAAAGDEVRNSSSSAVVGRNTVSTLWDKVINGEKIEISGKIRRLGSDPFSYLVITDADDKNWYLDKAGSVTLKQYEQRMVKVSGVVEMKEMVLANGKKMSTRRILTQVVLLNLYKMN